MSLESLSALKQLAQVREQGATIQNDNLEKVQQSVQQTSVTETQRVDTVNLEKVKAEYDVALQQAKVERLQALEERQQKAVLFQSIGLAVTTLIAAGDAVFNISKDLSGGQNLGSSKSRGFDEGNFSKDGPTLTDRTLGTAGTNTYVVGKSSNLEIVGADGSFNKENARTAGLTDSNGDLTKSGRSFLKLSDKDKATDANGNIDTSKRQKGDSIQIQRVLQITTGGDGSITNTTGAILSQEDLNRASNNDPKVTSFDGLFNKDKAAATNLFNKDNYTANFISKDDSASVAKIGAAALRAEGAKVGGNAALSELSAKDFEKYTRATAGNDGVGFKKGATSVLNGIVSLADVVVPQVQALLESKSKLEDTVSELQAAKEKLAAAIKKLKQLIAIISNPGTGGADGTNLGNGR